MATHNGCRYRSLRLADDMVGASDSLESHLRSFKFIGLTEYYQLSLCLLYFS